MAHARSRRTGQRDVKSLNGRAAVWALAAGVGACVPIPYTHMELVTPPIAGVVQRSDGSPVVGEVVAASGYGEPGSCGQSGPRTVTDTLGRFYLPKAEKQERIFWLTMVESFGGIAYWLCASSDSASAPTEILRAPVSGYVAGDSVSCLAWAWHDERRLTCDGRQRWRVVTAGHWKGNDRQGVYRIIFHPVDQSGWAQRVFVQWVETTAEGTPARLAAMNELPTADDVVRGYRPLHANGDQWYLTVTSIKKTKWGNDVFLTFKLGAPGQITFVPDSPGDTVFVHSPAH